mmetsp:Transcript_4094/g.9857  ORF Transcript_4094/g.9857 Transcript_4094/m.9857 type:complete len:156 (+) Transcript_4094:211-678(+)
MFGVAKLLRTTTAATAFVGTATKHGCRALVVATRSPGRHQQSFGTTTTTTALQASSLLPSSRFLLRYDYIPEVLEKRGPHRAEHIALAQKFIEEGTCLSGGPTGDVGGEVPTGALFVFADADAAKSYAENDPYVSNGIVTNYSVEEWTVVVEKQD